METFTEVWAYLIAIGFLPMAAVMALATYGLGRWYYGINDFFLKEVSIKTDTPEAIEKAKALNKALKVIKLLPIIVAIFVTVAMQWKPDRKAHDIIVSLCLGIAHSFIGVTLYETLIEFKIFKVLEAKFIKTGE